MNEATDFMKPETNPNEQDSRSLHGSAAYLAEDVSVGRLVRWIDREHLNAARETPPNMDYMRAMQRVGAAVEHALALYRQSTQPPNGLLSDAGGGNLSTKPQAQ